MLQVNRKMEFVFASHSFDVWESWSLEGPLEECRLVNCKNTQVTSYFPVLRIYMVKFWNFMKYVNFVMTIIKLETSTRNFIIEYSSVARMRKHIAFCIIVSPVIAIEV